MSLQLTASSMCGKENLSFDHSASRQARYQRRSSLPCADPFPKPSAKCVKVPSKGMTCSTPKTGQTNCAHRQLGTQVLQRGEYCPINPAAVVAVAPELIEVPLPYIKERFRSSGESMYNILGKLVCLPLQGPPTGIEARIARPTTYPPTHVFAVYEAPQPGRSSQPVTLMPYHGLLAAISFAHLKPLPPCATWIYHSDGSCTATLPVVGIQVPNTIAFAFITKYIYSKQAASLFPFLTRLHHLPSDIRSQLVLGDLISTARARSASFSRASQMNDLTCMKIIWNTMWALGLYDLDLILAIEVAYDVALKGLLMTPEDVHQD